MSTAMTWPAVRAQRIAVARPIPLPAPVTSTRVPDSFMRRLRAIIRSPWRGRSVSVASGSTGCPATRSYTNSRLIAAAISVASISAKLEPMQIRRPPPNGR